MVQDILLQKAYLTLIRDPEVWIQINFFKMIADNKQTEAVNRRDHRIVNERRLSSQVRIILIISTMFVNCCADTLTHLCRSRLGKSHNEKAINIDWILLICNTLDDTLDKHRCLTGTCRS